MHTESKKSISKLLNVLTVLKNTLSSYHDVCRIEKYNKVHEKLVSLQSFQTDVETLGKDLGEGTLNLTKKIEQLKQEVTTLENSQLQPYSKSSEQKVISQDFNSGQMELSEQLDLECQKSCMLPKYLQDFFKNFQKLNPENSIILSTWLSTEKKAVRSFTNIKKLFNGIETFLELSLGSFFAVIQAKYQRQKKTDTPKKAGSIEEQIKNKKSELSKLQKQQSELQSQIPALSKTDDSKKTDDSNFLKNIKKLKKESELLNEIEQQEDSVQNQYAKKMCLGFIGQYWKEILDNLSEYLSQDSLFISDIKSTIFVRHKHIMHDVWSADEKLINDTSLSCVLPWMDSVDALEVLSRVADIDSPQYSIVINQLQEASPKLDITEIELRLLGRVVWSYNRLGNSFNKVFKLLSKIEPLLQSVKTNAVTKFLMLEYLGVSFYFVNKMQDVREFKTKQISILEDNPDVFQNTNISNLKARLLCERSACSDYIGDKDTQKQDLEEAEELECDGYVKNVMILQFANFYQGKMRWKEAIERVNQFFKYHGNEIMDENDCELFVRAYEILHVCHGVLGEDEKSLTSLENMNIVLENHSINFKSLQGEFYNKYKAEYLIHKATILREQSSKITHLESQGNLDSVSDRTKYKEKEKLLFKSLEVYKEAYNLFKNLNLQDTPDAARNIYLHIGNIYRDLNKNKVAEYFLQKAQKILSESNLESSIEMGNVKAALACVYKCLNKNNAIELHKGALDIFAEHGTEGSFYLGYQLKSWAYVNNGFANLEPEDALLQLFGETPELKVP